MFGSWLMIVGTVTLSSCESEKLPDTLPAVPDELLAFPSYITPADKYFKLSIGEVPLIDKESYRLKISGAVDRPASYTLRQLDSLEQNERTLTIECIGNRVNGSLLGNANWKGFSVIDLLEERGIKAGATSVKYISADGYYTYNTMEELQKAEIMGALYMNGEPIPNEFGFPLRIIFPGYYGVRQPGWIVEIEVLETGPEDYWARAGWDTDSAMSIDSKFFFPPQNTRFALGDSIIIGGAAYGSRRISAVDISLDEGLTWIPASIKKQVDQDYVWVFWELRLKPQSAGPLVIHSRATAQDGSTQPQIDNEGGDGFNSWPALKLSVE